MAMKKVRYLIGAVGVVPALGVIVPAAAAAQPGSTRAAPAKLCGRLYQRTAVGVANFEGLVAFGTPTDRHCLNEVRGTIPRSQVGLEMRVRVYQNGGKIYQKYVHGSIFLHPDSTAFNINNIDLDASSACEALVYSTNTAKLAYGPVCEPVSP
jgi:hypothetical protein